MMNYKGYIGKVDFDDEQHIFTGEVINTRAVITFQGSSVKELEDEFKNSVDDYIEWCNKDGVEPEKPYSGKFNVRIYPQLHQRAAVGARILGMSLNSFMIKSLEDELELMHI
ncbi:Predicted nuclease of the RNAse H fold, HicB family [Pseudobutyrivibrio sp. NOR37]|uniref:Type II toxin-antitoxin system HicB family antitoxin n=1 Tax=Pseudobutyrivibrio xylanivorans TaxID=185007 RepID=A0A6M0LKB1_PSEXY|nr:MULTISPECIES: type II toxin-antitoxin system HicB family antitoxin [Pseudobutyrivibrio]NEX02836.1 type II toxin-antitoxin system HicB family antitoxin [Pseudobutyrivibrio xylanivorans]SFR85620.1 Predicted nuclease of the RNAse H fold, HicB family [Pseudobutyrivibrio sp. NOR37]